MVIHFGAVRHIFIVSPVILWKMRNAFILVSLCIGLASGFIVPPGGLELIDEDQAILADNNGKESQEAKPTLEDETGYIVLPFRANSGNIVDLESGQNRLEEKDLYDQVSLKPNNVNERSFIFINQKFKTPVVNQLYSSQDLVGKSYQSMISGLDVPHYKKPAKFSSPHLKSDSAKYLKPIKDFKSRNKYTGHLIPNTDSTGFSKVDIDSTGYPKSAKGFFDFKVKTKDAIKGLFFPTAAEHSQKVAQNTKTFQDDEHDFNRMQENRFDYNINEALRKAEEQREYIELLKRPLLRPMLTPDQKESELQLSLPQPPNNHYKAVNNKNNLVPKSPVNAHQFAMSYYDNYGFPSPYGYQRSIPQINYKPEELGIATDESLRKLISENNNIENKFLDHYIQNSLEGQVKNDRIKAKNNCSYADCVLKSKQQYLNGGVSSQPECKCGRKLMKQRDSDGFQVTETTNKEEADPSTDEVTPRSSESNDYSDMLTEEMNLKKLIED